MICFYCGKPACAKIGSAKGNIWRALFGGKSWDKKEKYVCREHFNNQPDHVCSEHEWISGLNLQTGKLGISCSKCFKHLRFENSEKTSPVLNVYKNGAGLEKLKEALKIEKEDWWCSKCNSPVEENKDPSHQIIDYTVSCNCMTIDAPPPCPLFEKQETWREKANKMGLPWGAKK